MRQIKFRGKSINGDWHFGLLSYSDGSRGHTVPEGWYISNKAGMPWAYQVRPETVGQYTELIDKKGVELVEGDIVDITVTGLAWGSEYEWRGVVVFSRGAFVVKSHVGKKEKYTMLNPNRPFEILGNIHDNTELIK